MVYLRRIATTGLVAVFAMLICAVPGAMAKTKFVEPMNQYVVSGGKVGPEDLARAGYDLTESGSTRARHKGRFAIVATPKQAQSLRDQGATVEAPFGLALRSAAPRIAADGPDARLRRVPAVEPDAGAVPDDVRDAAQEPEDLVPRPLPRATATSCKEIVYGRSLLGQPLDRLQGHPGSSRWKSRGHGTVARHGSARRRQASRSALQRRRSTPASGSPRRSSGGSSSTS